MGASRTSRKTVACCYHYNDKTKTLMKKLHVSITPPISGFIDYETQGQFPHHQSSHTYLLSILPTNISFLIFFSAWKHQKWFHLPSFHLTNPLLSQTVKIFHVLEQTKVNEKWNTKTNSNHFAMNQQKVLSAALCRYRSSSEQLFWGRSKDTDKCMNLETSHTGALFQSNMC